jgi:hypothetical protein
MGLVGLLLMLLQLSSFVNNSILTIGGLVSYLNTKTFLLSRLNHSFICHFVTMALADHWVYIKSKDLEGYSFKFSLDDENLSFYLSNLRQIFCTTVKKGSLASTCPVNSY